MNFLQDLTLGQYIPGSSIIHLLDPRTKIGAMSVLITILFLVNDFRGYLLLALFLTAIIIISKLQIRYVLRGLRSLFWLYIFTFVLHLFWTPGSSIPLFPLGPINATYEGLYQGTFITSRLVLLILATSLLTLTTSPLELTDGLERLLRPFKVIGVPSHELALMMTIALRFIPTLLEETERIMKAQMARGADFERGNLIQRAKNLVPILVPLFLSAFRRADELAIAMEARCYRGGENRTHLRELRITTRDYVTGVVMLGLVLVVFLLPRW